MARSLLVLSIDSVVLVRAFLSRDAAAAETALLSIDAAALMSGVLSIDAAALVSGSSNSIRTPRNNRYKHDFIIADDACDDSM